MSRQVPLSVARQGISGEVTAPPASYRNLIWTITSETLKPSREPTLVTILLDPIPG